MFRFKGRKKYLFVGWKGRKAHPTCQQIVYLSRKELQNYLDIFLTLQLERLMYPPDFYY